ncbi:MAG TPA: cytochrome P450 [Streptosporangiaceae bacterium]|jgi:cholest-4-en-3-one 26-monooxygenase
MPSLPEGFDFTDPDLYADRVPLEEFAELRRTAPLWWNPQPNSRGPFGDDGLWVASRYEDVRTVSLDSDTFSSAENSAIVRFRDGMTREQVEMQRVIMLNADPPEHTKIRKIVSRGFTPRAINALSDRLRERAERIVAAARDEGSGEFVTEVACELPLQAIAELLGVPQEDRGKLFTWSNQMLGYDDPDYNTDEETASVEILSYSMELAAERQKCPMDDIVTKLIQADLDGRGLNQDEFGFFMILLAVAGNETTRNAITHGMMALLDNPDQWELYKAERPKSAVEEIVRWSTPVTCFQRTATHDTEVGGQPVRKGERVGIFYASANNDTDVFTDPHRFDITRDPNPHLGFGGNGAHYCLGANLARMEIDLMFNAIADGMPDIVRTGEPRRLRSAWINGIKELPVRYG